MNTLSNYMTPEEIDYIREWAASGNEPRFVDRIPSVVMFRCCGPLQIGGGSWALSESGLTIASQAERIRELESEHAGQIEYELMIREEYDELKAAFAQACEVAEEGFSILEGEFGYKELTELEFKGLETMRANRERLLK
jgi:hypothetical protein